MKTRPRRGDNLGSSQGLKIQINGACKAPLWIHEFRYTGGISIHHIWYHYWYSICPTFDLQELKSFRHGLRSLSSFIAILSFNSVKIYKCFAVKSWGSVVEWIYRLSLPCLQNSRIEKFLNSLPAQSCHSTEWETEPQKHQLIFIRLHMDMVGQWLKTRFPDFQSLVLLLSLPFPVFSVHVVRPFLLGNSLVFAMCTIRWTLKLMMRLQ